MSFWNSKHIKARKEHICIYCRKRIEVGEKYHRETGIWEGDFNDYCLCERCSYLVNTFDQGEELGDIHVTVFENGLVTCPACGSDHLAEYTLSHDKMSAECECDNCDEKWTADLSEDELKEMVRRWSA